MGWWMQWGKVGARAGMVAACVAALLVGIGVGGVAASDQLPAPVRQVRSVNIPVKAVALTFDDGPSPTYTPAILNALNEFGAKGTFFVIGQELVRYPDIAKRAVADGMELANHGFHHLTLQALDPTAVEAEALPVEREITAIAGSRPILYRLPKGKGDARSLRALADMGYTVVYWSIDTRDYLPRDPARIAAQVEQQVRPGAIVIFHDGGGNQQHTVDALKILLPALKAQGYQMLTVSQLLELARTSG